MQKYCIRLRKRTINGIIKMKMILRTFLREKVIVIKYLERLLLHSKSLLLHPNGPSQHWLLNNRWESILVIEYLRDFWLTAIGKILRNASIAIPTSPCIRYLNLNITTIQWWNPPRLAIHQTSIICQRVCMWLISCKQLPMHSGSATVSAWMCICGWTLNTRFLEALLIWPRDFSIIFSHESYP